MSTAYVQLETGLGIKPRGAAGLVFQPLGTADFESLMKETEELLASAAEDTGTTTETKTDEYGYRWAILRDPDFEDIVVAVNTVSTQLDSGGYGDRLLCAVFAFEENGKPLYWIYNYKRGTFYPFVPTGKQAARLGARVPAEGPDGGRAAARGGARPRPPALGHPDLGVDWPAMAGEPASARLERISDASGWFWCWSWRPTWRRRSIGIRAGARCSSRHSRARAPCSHSGPPTPSGGPCGSAAVLGLISHRPRRNRRARRPLRLPRRRGR